MTRRKLLEKQQQEQEQGNDEHDHTQNPNPSKTHKKAKTTTVPPNAHTRLSIGRIAKQALEMSEQAQISAAQRFKKGDRIIVEWALATDPEEKPWRVSRGEVTSKYKTLMLTLFDDGLQGDDDNGDTSSESGSSCDKEGARRDNGDGADTSGGSSSSSSSSQSSQSSQSSPSQSPSTSSAASSGEEDDATFTIEFPCYDDETIIMRRIDYDVDSMAQIPQNLRWASNINIDAVRLFIYTCGVSVLQAAGTTGASAAAVVVVDKRSGTTHKYVKYMHNTSGKVAEWIAFLAGIRIAAKHPGDVCAVITTDDAIYKAHNQSDEPRDHRVKRLHELSKIECVATTHVVHQPVSKVNCAKMLATNSVQSGISDGDQRIFEQPPHEPVRAAGAGAAAGDGAGGAGRRRGAQRQRMQQVHVNVPDTRDSVRSVVDQIKSVEQFASMRKFHARSRCPRGAETMWTQAVQHSLRRILNARTIDERSKELIGLILLPQLFMSTRASVERIVQHLADGKVFAVGTLDAAAQRQHQQQQNQNNNNIVNNTAEGQDGAPPAPPPPPPSRGDDQDRRNKKSRRVEQLCADYKIKNAVKLMQADAAAEQRSFDENAEVLRNKFPQREAEHDFPAVPPTYIAPFDEKAVIKRISKMSRNAATAIDAWTRDLLIVAVMQDSRIAEQLGVVMAWIATSHGGPDDSQNDKMYFNRLAMDIVRAARLVGIAKPEGGVRPIVISCFFAKLTGALILDRAGVGALKFQYAIAYARGAERIVHRARDAYNKGKAIVRLDSANAFNITKRSVILDMLRDKLANDRDSGVTAEMVHYFITMYQPTSLMFLFGPGGRVAVILSSEGVRQGDALSSFYFCLVQERACIDIDKQFKPGEIDIECFMDDGTYIVDPVLVPRVVAEAFRHMQAHGFKINIEKSAVICKNGLGDLGGDAAALGIPVTSPADAFKMLGAIVNDNYNGMNEMLRGRIGKFFDSLDDLDAHPEIKHTILYLCGRPKLLYFTATTPPEHSKDVVTFFDNRCADSFARLIHADVAAIDRALLHDDGGAGIPNYGEHAETIYANSLTAAITGARDSMLQVRLTTSLLPSSSHAEAEYDSTWSRYIHSNSNEQLVPHLYTVALAMRVNAIPRFLCSKARRCGCHILCEDPRQIIAHALRCDQMSHISCAARHTFLKSAIENIARKYGIICSNEPNFYKYNSLIQQRPDATFYCIAGAVATDFTIVSPADNKPAGDAARRAAEAKVVTHAAAVAAAGHEFFPFAVETSGHIDDACFKLFAKLVDSVPKYERYYFRRDLHCAASTAIAQFRARAVYNACNRFEMSGFARVGV